MNEDKVASMSPNLNTPVLFLIFNRFDTTKQVFEAIRKAAPPRLYIASDGPRDNREGEKEKVETVREYILGAIDWDCEVKTLFREKNLGCGRAVSSAITWFFEHEEMGIILEDDCLPAQSFFKYCEELLEYYKDDTRIFYISGYNKQGTWNEEKNDYFFSNLGTIWGWASWARAWKQYDINMTDIDDFIKNNNFERVLGKELGKIRQKTIYTEIKIKKTDTWDYQWMYTLNKNNSLSCVPSKNLITNIGFGVEATHTKIIIKQPASSELSFPLKKNNFIIPDRMYDEKLIDRMTLTKRLIVKIKKNFKKLDEAYREMRNILLNILRRNQFVYFLIVFMIKIPILYIYPIIKSPLNNLRQGKRKSGKPIELQLPITYKCNFDCVMCGMQEMKTQKDFSPDELEKILCDPLFNKIRHVGVNGGEPFIKNNLVDYINVLIKTLPNIRTVYFITNGYFSENIKIILPEIKRQCNKYGIKVSLALSVDAVGKLQDKVRGKEGAFSRLEETCTLLLKEPNLYYDYISAICTITKYNIYNLNEVHVWSAKNGIPVNYNIATIHERVCNAGKYDDFTIFNDRLAKQMAAEFFYEKFCETNSQKYFALYYYILHQRRLTQCTYQKNYGVTLTPNKQLAYCATFSKEIGDAYNNSASRLFYGNLNYRKELCHERCSTCSHYSYELTIKSYSLYIREIFNRYRLYKKI